MSHPFGAKKHSLAANTFSFLCARFTRLIGFPWLLGLWIFCFLLLEVPAHAKTPQINSITLYDATTFQGLPNTAVRSFCGTQDARTFVLGTPDGAYLLDVEQKTVIPLIKAPNASPSLKDVCCVACDWERNLFFVGTKSEGLAMFSMKEGRLQWYKKPELISNYVRNVAYDGASRQLFVGTAAGMDVLSVEDQKQVKAVARYTSQTSPKLISGSVRALVYDSAAKKKFVAEDGGITVVDAMKKSPVQYTPFTKPEILSEFVRSLLYDSVNGRIFVGMSAMEGVFSFGGVSIIDVQKNSSLHFTQETPPHLSSQEITSLAYDEKRNIVFVGNAFQGVDVLDLSENTSTNWSTKTESSWASDVISSLYYDSAHDVLFAGTAGGLMAVKLNRGEQE